MTILRCGRVWGAPGLFALALAATAPTAAHADILSNNLADTSGGTEAATGADWLTASFATGSSSEVLNSITLSLSQATAGSPVLSLYSDGGLQPGSLLGTLLSPTGYSSSLTGTTFETSGLSLAANTTYWAVLHAPTGEYDWSYTNSDTGTGAGFTDTWGQSSDSGADWFTYDSAPTQMSVAATPAAAPAAVPEAGGLPLLLAGLPLALVGLRRCGTRPPRRSHAAFH